MIWDLRAAMAANPDHVYTGIDCRNAFGEAQRRPAMLRAQQACPQLARLFHNLWNATTTIIHIPDGPGSTAPLIVTDGFVQGGCEAAPAFALCLDYAFRSVTEDSANKWIYSA